MSIETRSIGFDFLYLPLDVLYKFLIILKSFASNFHSLVKLASWNKNVISNQLLKQSPFGNLMVAILVRFLLTKLREQLHFVHSHLVHPGLVLALEAPLKRCRYYLS